jgi:hypothetical protein
MVCDCKSRKKMLSLPPDNFANDKWRIFDFIIQKGQSLFFRLADFAMAEECTRGKETKLAAVVCGLIFTTHH